MSTRLLILSAAAFALGISSTDLLAQQTGSSSGSGTQNNPAAQENPNAGRPWRIRSGSRNAPRQQAGAIRVVSPGLTPGSNASEGNLVLPRSIAAPTTPNTSGSPAGTNAGGTITPGSSGGPGDARLAPPPPERRVGAGRFRNRSNLAEPQGLSMRVEDGRRIFLTWSDRASNETSYVVQRRKSIMQAGRLVWGPTEEVLLSANVTSFRDAPDEPGDYAYRVAAGSTNGRSWFSAWTTLNLAAAAFPVLPEVVSPTQPTTPTTPTTPNTPSNNPNTTTPPAPPEPPATPTGVQALDAGARRAVLRWTGVSGIQYYQVERSPAMSTGTAMVPADQVEFIDESGVGSFEYRIRAVSSVGPSAYSPWQTVSIADIIPLAPNDLNALSMNDFERVRLSWLDNSDNETAFIVERSTRDGDNWTSPVSISVLPNRTQQVDAPGPGDHRYRILAQGSAGASSASPWVNVTVATDGTQSPSNPGNPLVPPVPASLSVQDANSQNARVSWQGVVNADWYDIERNPAFSDGRIRVPASPTQYVDSSGPGTFQYRLRAGTGASASDWTNWQSVTVADIAPATPSDLSATHVGDHQRVSLAWSDNSNNETGFRIERQTQGSGGWNPVQVLLAQRDSATQVDEPGPGTHRYRVAAINGSGVSSFTGWQVVTVPVPPVDPSTLPPASPGNLGASDQGRRASIMWSDASANELGFELEREPAFPGRMLLSANVTGYMDNCGPGEFRYRVRAYNNAGLSDWTPWSTVTINETVPTSPSDVIATDAGDQENITLQWGDNSFNETGFRIERTTWTSNAWTSPVMIMADANDTELSDDPGLGRFRYRVQAINNGGESPWSEAAIVSVTDGWTTPALSSDSREVFVSSSMGQDTNSGLSPDQPVRTLLRGYQLLRDNMPDHLRLKRGDVWTNEVLGPWGQHGTWDKNGRSADEPMAIWYYGEGERPLLKTGTRDRVVNIMGDGMMGNLQFIGLQFVCHTRKITDPDYTPDDPNVRPPTAFHVYGRGANILIEDCYFDSYGGHMAFMVPNERLSEGWILNNITLRRNVLVDAYANGPQSHSSAIFTSNIDGLLIEDNVFDHNGWSQSVPNRPSNIYNHNMYLVFTCQNVVVRNNITARAAATGIQMRGQSMHAINNLALKNPLGITSGHAMATWPDQGWTGSMKYNVILDSADIGVEGQPGFAPRGFGIVFGRSIGGTIEHNIVAHNTTTRGNEPAIWTEMPGTSVGIRNNIIYNWVGQMDRPFRGNLFRMDVPLPAAAVIEDNVFQQPTSGYLIQIPAASPGGTWARNRYAAAGNPETQWFVRGTAEPFNYASWVQRTGESGGTTTPANFPDPSRTIASYMASLGQEPTLEKFLEEARKQTRTNWRVEYTAQAVNQWIRAGFGMDEPEGAVLTPPRQVRAD